MSNLGFNFLLKTLNMNMIELNSYHPIFIAENGNFIVRELVDSDKRVFSRVELNGQVFTSNEPAYNLAARFGEVIKKKN